MSVDRVQVQAVVTVNHGDGMGPRDIVITVDYKPEDSTDALARALLDKKQEQHDALITATNDPNGGIFL